MKFCSNCGAQMQDNERFCPQCGKESASAQQPQQPQQAQYNAQPQYAQQPYAQQQYAQQQYGQQPQQQQQNVFSKFMNTPDASASFNPTDVQQNKVMAVVSYLGILALIPFFGAKQSPYAQYHAKQGMNLLLVNIGVAIITFLLRLIKVKKSYYLWVVEVVPLPIRIICWILWLVVLAFSIIGIVFAAQGKAKELPIIGKYIKIFK